MQVETTSYSSSSSIPMRNDAFGIGEIARKYDKFEQNSRRIIIVRSYDTIIIKIDDVIDIVRRHCSLLIILTVIKIKFLRKVVAGI